MRGQHFVTDWESTVDSPPASDNLYMISLFYCRFVSGIRGYWMIFQPLMRREELVKLTPVLNIFL